MENYINHIVLVLDASGSMQDVKGSLVRVADNQIDYLARRSKDLDQETRITVYTFNDPNNIRCLVYDKDVLRMPSISGLYSCVGTTALVDATLWAISDLRMTPERYGEHAFLIYVLTDGEENSSIHKPSGLSDVISRLPDNWTLATFVPNQRGVFEAKKFGFPPQNISVWDATSAIGVSEVGDKIRQTTETFMQNRTLGIRGTKTLFQMEAPSVQMVTETLPYLTPGQYRLINVGQDTPISSFVENFTGRPYRLGEAYYQLTKREEIQPQKQIVIMYNYRAYVGAEARKLLGLPDYSVNVAPSSYPVYDIYVQSTSVNRKLLAGTNVLVLS